MLAIRMQRTGRKGHAMFRVIVQDSRVTPTSGKYVALLGNYDPHAKTAVLDKEKAAEFLKNGARPSERVARLLKGEGVKLPLWVELNDKKAGTLRHADKLRKNRPAEPQSEETPVVEEPAAEAPVEEPSTESPEPADEAPTEEPTADEAKEDDKKEA